jgi:hypothetical protein
MTDSKSRFVKVEPYTDKTINVSSDLANGDWLNARRLLLKEKEGDVEATRELTKMENTPLVKLVK